MSRILIDVKLRRDDFSLSCELDMPGKGVMAILGPSGSGKTTLLRLIAGLEKADQGSIRVNGHRWLDTANSECLSPQKRKVGMVFQDYALFDHLTVAQNIGYGLPRKQRKQSVKKWVGRFHLESFEHRYPNELSGGQRQRVALARALAPEPDILLLDEPFSAVDVPLREKLRIQLQEIVSTLDQPVMMVTHDLEEARYLADHIAVMVNGQVCRHGFTNKVFNDPGSYEVAKILGWRNFIQVKSICPDSVAGDWGELVLDREISPNTDWLAIRPYHIRIANESQDGIDAEVLQVREMGALREMECRLNDGTSLVMQSPWNDPLLAPGSRIRLNLPLQHVRALFEGTAVNIVAKKKTMVIPISGIVYNSARNGAILPLEKHPSLTQERISNLTES